MLIVPIERHGQQTTGALSAIRTHPTSRLLLKETHGLAPWQIS